MIQISITYIDIKWVTTLREIHQRLKQYHLITTPVVFLDVENLV